MKKVVTINIAGRSFYIDEDAFARLEEYLKKLEIWSREKEGGQEIYDDIEARIRELFEDKINPTTGVITIDLVEEIVNTMGQPEDFSEEPADNESSGQEQGNTFSTVPPRRRLYRDVEDRVFGGVCSGIAAYFDIDRVVVRVLFAVLPFLSFGAIIPIYIILWIAIPPALTAAQRLEMQGHDVNISNIEKNIRNEYNEVKRKFRQSRAYRKGEDYLGRFHKRDRTALVITAVIVGVIIMANLVNIPFELGWNPAFHFDFPFSHFGFPGIFPLVLILLILGLSFRSAMKGFLILIAVVLLAAFLFKMLGVFAWPHMMHTFM
ncbi:PspC domain-containing protein [Anaerophaga thermohalophila]|uniref:PspC domain-containing protein n=1 Tax=Anaerophaga thermohalophila TaxID=177400 RepID=UPI000237D55D|nr:PspC domain-containing protein [Anaerophaga thermohalophila]